MQHNSEFTRQPRRWKSQPTCGCATDNATFVAPVWPVYAWASNIQSDVTVEVQFEARRQITAYTTILVEASDTTLFCFCLFFFFLNFLNLLWNYQGKINQHCTTKPAAPIKGSSSRYRYFAVRAGVCVCYKSKSQRVTSIDVNSPVIPLLSSQNPMATFRGNNGKKKKKKLWRKQVFNFVTYLGLLVM